MSDVFYLFLQKQIAQRYIPYWVSPFGNKEIIFDDEVTLWCNDISVFASVEVVLL
jgi:hypothetical protein